MTSASAESPVTVVGIDGSEQSGDALQWAVNYMQNVGGSVQAVTVWHQPVQFGYRLASSDRELEKRARQALDEVVEPFRGSFTKGRIRAQLVHGNPVDVLVEYSEQADLLVMGNKGHGAFRGMMLGSIAQKLVHHAKCPVVIVR